MPPLGAAKNREMVVYCRESYRAFAPEATATSTESYRTRIRDAVSSADTSVLLGPHLRLSDDQYGRPARVGDGVRATSGRRHKLEGGQQCRENQQDQAQHDRSSKHSEEGETLPDAVPPRVGDRQHTKTSRG